MRLYTHKKVSAFTLVELAIVLAIVGVLTVGLFRLIANSNAAQSNTAAANQQLQLISSVKAFLASTSGGLYMENNASCGGVCAADKYFNLPLPSKAPDGLTNAACNGSYTDPNLAGSTDQPGFCSFLPPSFYSGTTNSYGQTYSIQVLRDNTPNPDTDGHPTVPQTYSFMIIANSTASGAKVIADSSGGSISSQIGSDGGFVFTSNVCGTPTSSMACGAYSNWSSLVTVYGFSGATNFSGSVASRTFVSPLQDTNEPWLARVSVNDTSLNTMSVPMYMGTLASLNMANVGATTGGVPINMQGGAINMVAGTLNMQGGTLNLTDSTTGAVPAKGNVGPTAVIISIDNGVQGGGLLMNSKYNSYSTTPASASQNPVLSINAYCTRDMSNGTITKDPNCPPALSIGGDINISGGRIFGATSVYTGSDVRLKTDIQVLNDPLKSLMQLKAISYRYKDSSVTHLGVIAQDVEKVYPQIVGKNPDGYKAVDYQGLIAPLLGAVQELKIENNALRHRVEALERQSQSRSN